MVSGGHDGGWSRLRRRTRSDGFTLWDVAKSVGIPVAAYESAADRYARLKAMESARRKTLRNRPVSTLPDLASMRFTEMSRILIQMVHSQATSVYSCEACRHLKLT